MQTNKRGSLRVSSVNIGTIQRNLAWPLRKDDTHTHKSRSVNNNANHQKEGATSPLVVKPESNCILERKPTRLYDMYCMYVYVHIYIYREREREN